ncbi:MAG: zf-HC2 domain-containing protein, partial [Streptosporangiaceae bacterium]
MRARRTSLHALVGAYVLDAIPDSDRAQFERHLLTCEQCRDDVRGQREAGALLAAAVAVTPRPELR